jgi:glutathione S-transferase
MKLFLNKTSPYARLARITAIEAGLADGLELVWIEPWDNAPALLAVNPLSKIPALVTDEGATLVESGCICDYLATKASRTDLLPADIASRTDTLKRLGLARAAMDCAFGAVIQRRFSDGATPALAQRWLDALPRATFVVDGLYAARRAKPDLGDIAMAVAFDYIGFRLPEIDWRRDAPSLAKMVDTMTARASFQSTRPA